MKFMKRINLFSPTSTLVPTFSTQLVAADVELTILPNHANIYRGAIAFARKQSWETLLLLLP